MKSTNSTQKMMPYESKSLTTFSNGKMKSFFKTEKWIGFLFWILLLGSAGCHTKVSTTPYSGNLISGSIPCTISANSKITKGTYHVDCNIEVQSPAVLSIEPGTILIFNQSAGVTVDAGAAIISEGNDKSSIVFKGAQAIKGYWDGIYILSKSLDNRFAYTTISDAGTANVDASVVLEKASASFKHCQILNGGANGIRTNKDYTNNEDFTIFNAFENNVISGQANYPLLVYPACAATIGTGNTLSGNGSDYIALRNPPNSVNVDVTLSPSSVPFLITEAQTTFTKNLTLKPGTTMVMASGTYIWMNFQASSFTAVGTASNPITIRGKEATEGYWSSIGVFSNSTQNQVAYCNFSDGGAPSGGGSSDIGFINLYSIVNSDQSNHPQINVHNCNFTNSHNTGIRVWCSPAYSGTPIYNADIETSNNFGTCSPHVVY